ncbi:MAG TPA: DUF1206 domain-containing protein [Propionibacteriaceae bacterium]
MSYGLVHLVLAWIALKVAFGKGGDASSQGAFAELAQQPTGAALLWVMAIGLFTLTIWQALEATVGRDEPGRDSRPRRRIASAGRAVVYAGLGALAVRVALGGGSKSGQSEDTLSERLMSAPFGQFLVAALGAAIIAVGVSQIVKGVKQKFTEDLDRAETATRRLGTVGYCAKGLALAIIGGLFGWAAISYDPEKAGGMDAALTTVRDQPFGIVLLTIMAAGIASFAIYCFVWARHARY